MSVPRLADGEQVEVCAGLSGAVASTCWMGLWQLFGWLPVDELEGPLLEACGQAGVFADSCFKGFGQMLFWRAKSHGVGDDSAEIVSRAEWAVRRCPSVAVVECVEGVASTTAQWWVATVARRDGFVSVCDRPVLVEVSLAADVDPVLVAERCSASVDGRFDALPS